ncbi:MAG: protein kinase domain-containing protein [Bacteroidales bacterium]
MTPERRRRIESLCLQALGMGAAERGAFLAEACGADAELRGEVESLLEMQPGAPAFLEAPAWAPPATPLTRGTRLGPYEIRAFVGAGGMGDVYKAHDTRLDRTVAIKVLPPAAASDPERRARFEREAKAIAALNHSHICTLYDVGDRASDASTPSAMYLVMEYLSGQTLAERLRSGPLPLSQALVVATEIADGLAAAHRQGVIHRDLKPGNVMLTKSGVKLLDFGLAKLKARDTFAAARAGSSTKSEPETAAGTLLGTVPYMAPEQLEGKEADARGDIFSLGAVLYEMVSGKRAFEGDSHASVVAAIMTSEPAPLCASQPLAPPALDLLVRQCLAKSADDRPDTAHDVANDLRRIREASGAGQAKGRPARRRSALSWAALVATGVLAAMVGGAAAMWLMRASPLVAHVSVEMRPADELHSGGSNGYVPGGSRTAFAWTPDGRALVFVGRRAGRQQLYVRALAGEEARPLAGTDGARVPAVSPDGRWVAFWAGDRTKGAVTGGALNKVSLTGGPIVEIAPDIPAAPAGLAWDSTGWLYFGGGQDRIWRVRQGQKPTPVTTLGDGEIAHVLPSVLRGGDVLLYTVRRRLWTWGDEAIVAEVPATGQRKVLLRDAVDARYVNSGHLVFLRRGVLTAVAFDPVRLTTRGEPVPLIDSVSQALTSDAEADQTGAGQFSVAPTGALAWVRVTGTLDVRERLVVLDRLGRVSTLGAPEKDYSQVVRLSPDGSRLAVGLGTLRESGIWTYDFARATLTPVTQDGEPDYHLWTPDGEHLVFAWLKDGRRSLAWQRTNAAASPEILASGHLVPSSWSPDGRQLAVTTGFAGGVAVATLDRGRATMQPMLDMSGAEQFPELSPDGSWLAYTVSVSGRNEVFVREHPGLGHRRRVSVDGGSSPAWNRNRRELFFVGAVDQAGKRRIMSVAFSPGSSPGPPRVLFEFDPREFEFACTPVRCYDVAPDGEHFYTVQRLATVPLPPVTRINLVLNWLEELKARAPGW